MASHIPSAKSGNDWTRKELLEYNIQIVEQSFAEFFNQDQLPPVPPALRHFCEITDRAFAPDEDTYKLLHYLDLAQNPKIGEESVVDSFVARLLETLGYASGRRVALTHQTIPLIARGMKSSALTDICICDESGYLLLVQTDKELEYQEDLAPQIIAEAVAAYQRNNFICDRVLRIPMRNEITFPCITLTGTSPTFYKIKITKEFDYAVMGGLCPADPVIVYRHIPRLPRRESEGMRPLENRSVILQYYQAFKAFV